MNVQDTNEIRELTVAELNEVTGGVGPLVVAIVLGASAAYGAALATPGTDFVEEGKKYLQGKGGQL